MRLLHYLPMLILGCLGGAAIIAIGDSSHVTYANLELTMYQW